MTNIPVTQIRPDGPQQITESFSGAVPYPNRVIQRGDVGAAVKTTELQQVPPPALGLRSMRCESVVAAGQIGQSASEIARMDTDFDHRAGIESG